MPKPKATADWSRSPSLTLPDPYPVQASEPILLITSAGADPSLDLEEFAHATVGKDRFASLPMGGQTQILPLPLALNQLIRALPESLC